jgi:flagellar basal-body rod modification protein FlgD
MTTTTASTSAANVSLAQAAAQAALVNATSSTSGTSNSNSATSLTNPLVSLGSNFTDFLNLLTTQLQNQDPTSPMDTNQFTQELVEFTGVQQSVATNSNLSQLISLTQGSEVLQSTQVVGKVVTASSPQMALQGGTGTLTFTAPQAEPVTVAIVNAAGQTVTTGTLSAQAGPNAWVWNGQDSNGNTVADGAYGVALETGSDGAAVPLPFSVIGTATGLTNSASGMVLDMGAVQVPLANVQSLNSASNTGS